MFGLRRREVTRGRLMRNELGESFDHLKQAAGHAAGSLGETVRPRVAAVRGHVKPVNMKGTASQGWGSTMAALAPLAAAARQGAVKVQKAQAMQMKKMSKKPNMKQAKARRRWPMLVGMLGAGAAVGAMMRRRRRQQWDEYDADRALESVQAGKSSFDRSMDKAASGVDQAVDAAAQGTDKAAGKMSSAGEKTSSSMPGAKEKMESATDTAKRQTGQATDKAEDLITRAGSPSKNNRS